MKEARKRFFLDKKAARPEKQKNFFDPDVCV
jgi:hypothetical protein